MKKPATPKGKTVREFTDHDRDIVNRALSLLDYISHKAHDHGSFSVSRNDLLYNQIQECIGSLAFLRDRFDPDFHNE